MKSSLTPPYAVMGRVLTGVQTYAVMGRVLTGVQTTDVQPYTISYQYNLAGGMTSETYPSGKVVVTEYDSAGRIAGVKKDPTTYYAGGTPATANAMSYTAHGGVSTMRLGNGKWEHTNYNSRLQPELIGLGTVSSDSSVLKLDYAYSTAGQTNNNGNVRTQTITIGAGTPTPTTISQSYDYDSLNRLSSATETGAWTQTYDCDRYGNRAMRIGSYIPVANIGLTPLSVNSTDFSAFDQTTNRLNKNIQVQANVTYDVAGNLAHDAGSGGYSYDAENRLTNFNNGAGQYFYDGDGRRVKKIDSTGITVFVYNAGGQLIAEYHNDPVPPAAGGGGTSYLTSDHLGSTRVVTDGQGNVKARHDYLPFGEELGAGIGQRTAAMKYDAPDSTRQKFTQKERDNESGLDHFGARYYGSTQGRFTSPDPVIISTRRMVNPQIWNLYSYVGNNPLSFVDPTGEELVRLGQHTDEQIDARRKAIDEEKKAARKDSSLTKAQQDEKRGKLEAEKKTLGLEKEGNRVVGALLSALDSEGQRNGLALTDFTLSTDTKNDFQGYATPDAMKTLLNDQAFVIQNNRKFSGTIYVRTEPSYGFYQLSQTYPDFRYYGGGVVRHEQEHLLGRGEGPAYRVQDNVMHLFQKHFQNKDIYKTLDEALHDAIKKNP